ncbi:MAG TPA: DUF2269 family protein [Acidimicrobiia bacterium]|nr:DUF2269 family protein [Acidimicrobiia bacterium]
MLAAGTESDVYKVLLLLHILAVVVGIGSQFVNGLYGLQAKKRPGPGGRAVAEANYAVGSVAEYLIYSIPVSGILLVVASDDAWSFSDTWITLSFVLYAAALGIAHAVLRKNQRRMIALLAEMEAQGPPAGGPPPQAAELGRLGGQQAKFGAVMQLLTVALITLMIWKPGS